ncbi:penicillin-binding protein 1C [Stappia sp. MMSF_3263]|uniref:penicillin-binding protein 1C n=1 Tax=Stappia sp. MMSF_3263 TaxID=3046693 RepID=UPI00273E9B7B|nr:penicillin-binding protein 1C [Stappia sp. MMSF_3263]
MEPAGDRAAGLARRMIRHWRWLAFIVLAIPVAAAGALAYGVLTVDRQALLAPVEMSRIVTDRDGTLLRAFQTGDDRWRLPLDPETVDPLYLRMLLAYEDRRYHEHYGVDPRAVLRAGAQALSRGRIVSGASTLTMQTARLVMEEPTRSLAMKWRQVVSALALERELDKRDILSLYLARAPFGGNIEGVRAASLAWFGKEPARLTPAQAALLVALPQSPEARRPDRDAIAARAARDRVLAVMEEQGVLDRGTVAAARREPVPTRRRPAPMLAPHATRQALARSGGAPEVRLTLDAGLQARLEAMVSERAARLGRNVSVALLVADHGNGEILAHVGSAGLLDEARRGHVDMTGAIRSPGSTLKPLIYGLAFEEGIAHPDSLIEDRPTTLSGYSPTNFDLAFQGTVRVRQALTASLNVPAVALLDAVGVSRFVARLRRAGTDPRFPEGEAPGLAAALGGFGLTLRDLVQLYAGLARGGRPVVLRETFGTDAHNRPGPDAGAVLSAGAAWRIGEILSEVPPPDTANGEGIAYKTGTSYGYRDAWAIGYDGRHVVGVWVGRADGTPVPGITGYQSATPILFDAFQRVGAKRTPLPRAPRGLEAERDQVPAALHYARTATRQDGLRAAPGPEIFYPPDGATVDLGLSDAPGASPAMPLVIKARRGRAPFLWLANGAPVASGPFATALTWVPDGPGASVISVIDADGNAARITLTIR